MSNTFVLKRIYLDILAPSDWDDKKAEEILDSEVIDELDDKVRYLVENACFLASKELKVEESTRKL